MTESCEASLKHMTEKCLYLPGRLITALLCDFEDPHLGEEQVPFPVWEHRSEGTMLGPGAVLTHRAAHFRAAEGCGPGWEGSLLGSVPHVHGTSQLCFSNAIQMKAERGNPVSLGIALRCISAEFCLLAFLLQNDTQRLSADQFVYHLLDYLLQ